MQPVIYLANPELATMNYSLSEGTVSVLRNFLQGYYCAFYKCYAVIILSNLQIFPAVPEDYP